MDETIPPYYRPEPTGVRKYVQLGIFLIILGVGMMLLGINLAQTPMSMITALDLSGQHSGNSYAGIALAVLANIVMILGGGMILLAVTFDLLHRFRATKG